VRNVTAGLRVAAVAAVFCTLVCSASSQAAPPRYVPHFMAFITLYGKGSVTSVPKGIHCPGACRALFLENSHLELQAVAAPGWHLVKFSGYCTATTADCGFDLVSPHDCFGPLCPIGAFGTRVYFVRNT
jgi:hypothetical protein